MPACNHNALNSGRISVRLAPILLILRNPLMPNVDGKTQEKPCQKEGILLSGHETPVIKSNGTEVKTTKSITFSRYLTKHESIRPKKTHDKIYGKRKPRMVVHVTILTKPNSLGTTNVRYIPNTA